MNEQELLALADDELILGWRESEWTGIAPLLEEDVAFSSIAQNEIGHARAVYELLSGSRSDAGEAGASAPGRAPSSLRAHDADALALDRSPAEYRCAPLVQLHLLDWGRTIARRWLYEVADEIRIAALMDELPLARKIDREERYHRMHAELWHARLSETPQFRAAVEELWPYALGVLPPEQRDALSARAGLPVVAAIERGTVVPELAALWDEMTMVRRSAPAGAAW